MMTSLPVAVSLALLSCSPDTYSSTRDSSKALSAAIVSPVTQVRPRMREKLEAKQKSGKFYINVSKIGPLV